MKYEPLYDLLRQASIITESPLMYFYDYSWQICTETGRSTDAYIIFYQVGPIHHDTHVPGPVAQSSAESEYNEVYITGMALVNLRMLINELLNKYSDMVPEEAFLIIMDSKSAVCISNNGKDTNHARQISRRVKFVRNGENVKIHKIDWCEVGLQLADIGTNHVCGNYLNARMKYIMVRLNKLYRTLVQER